LPLGTLNSPAYLFTPDDSELVLTTSKDTPDIESIERLVHVVRPEEEERQDKRSGKRKHDLEDTFVCGYLFDRAIQTIRPRYQTSLSATSGATTTRPLQSATDNDGEVEVDTIVDSADAQIELAKLAAKLPDTHMNTDDEDDGDENAYIGNNADKYNDAASKLRNAELEREHAEGYTAVQTACRNLQLSAVPDKLPCREKESNKVYNFLHGALRRRGGVGSTLYISGMPGTGKTATVLEVVRRLTAEIDAQSDNDDDDEEDPKLPPFQFVEVNGTLLRCAD
jgi:hypothetical protein